MQVSIQRNKTVEISLHNLEKNVEKKKVYKMKKEYARIKKIKKITYGLLEDGKKYCHVEKKSSDEKRY